MRLKNLSGFNLNPGSLDYGPAGIDAAECRLAAYSENQSQAIYVSETFSLHQGTPIHLEKVDFAQSPEWRAFRIAIQLLSATCAKHGKENHSKLKHSEESDRDPVKDKHGDDKKWTVRKGWLLDTRTLKPASTAKRTPGLTVRTDQGTMAVPDNWGASSSSSTYSTGTTLRPLNDLGAENFPDMYHEDEDQQQSNSWFLWGRITLGTDKQSSKPTKKRYSLTYPVLVDLWTLQHSIDEAKAACHEIAGEADNLLPNSALPLNDREKVLERKLRRIRKHCTTLRAETAKIEQEAAQKVAFKKKVVHNLRKSVVKAQGSFTDDAYKNVDTKDKELIMDSSPKITIEQSRLASELLDVFPIEPVGDGKFHFTINGIMLPSVFAINQYDPAQIGAVLGFVAQVVVCISRYLDVALPYPITVCGSQSYITDNISRIKHGSINFPLWTRGVLLYRVEYALYLLHKDIEQLLNWVKLAVADLKQTLANLKNLLLVISSAA